MSLALHRPLLICAVFAAGVAWGCTYPITEAPAAEGSNDETTQGCFVGALGCSCTNGGGCDPGLECVAGICEEAETETETGECVDVGCPCTLDEDCGAELLCEAGMCVSTTCGDGILDPQEECDDGDAFDGDGCDSDCTRTEILKLALGGLHTCALIEGGRVRCWGSNGTGQIGLGAPGNIGDDELASAAVDLPLPAVVDLIAGGAHTCAILENGDLRCWGFNTSGQLGLGNTAAVFALGDDETIDNGTTTELGGPVQDVGMGVVQTCAAVEGALRCFGGGVYGQLGINGVQNVGDDELPLSIDPVQLGAEAMALAVAGSHGCALTATGAVRCWGRADSGQLGYGNAQNIGDNEHPLVAGEVMVIPPTQPPGTSIVDIGAGLAHTCVLLSSEQVLCWGANSNGELGQGNNQAWGNDPGETPSALMPIQLNGSVTQLAVGYQHNCALLDNGDVRCWGIGAGGQLGYANDNNLGDDELVIDEDPVEIGGPALAIYAGGAHSCAIRDDFEVLCWGSNDFGQLGYGFVIDIGDDEIPEIAGPVSIL